MAANQRSSYEVTKVKSSPPKTLARSRALGEAFEAPPTDEELQARQDAIGNERRTVPVPPAPAAPRSADEVEDEYVSDEPEAEISE